MEGLLPEGTIDVREVEEAVVRPTRNDKPTVRVNFVEGGVMTLGPFDYYSACRDEGLEGDAAQHYVSGDPWSMWPYLPKDPSWLVGRSISFKVEHIEQNDVTYQAFRFLRVVV